MDNSKVEKLVIIGSGPAGLTAAIYAARSNLSPLVVAGRQAGGQLMLTSDVDDFPGFLEAIQGPDLIMRMRKQAERFGSRFIEQDVISVNFSQKPFLITAESKQYQADSVIIATGASAKWLNLKSEQKLIGRGVSACAICDGLFFKDKHVAVVGGGDTAMREAQYLSKICKQVTIIHRRNTLKAQDALQKLVKSKSNVDFIWNTVVEDIQGEEKVESLVIKNVQTGKVENFPVDGVFIAIGHKPNTDFLIGQLELDEKGYIIVKDDTKTSVEGIFLAGDVADTRYKQAITAAGAGSKAALDADEYLENLKI